MLTSSGGSLNADRGEGGKICQNIADVICEHSLNKLYIIILQLFKIMLSNQKYVQYDQRKIPFTVIL